jgi:hypothetical protein
VEPPSPKDVNDVRGDLLWNARVVAARSNPIRLLEVTPTFFIAAFSVPILKLSTRLDPCCAGRETQTVAKKPRKTLEPFILRKSPARCGVFLWLH